MKNKVQCLICNKEYQILVKHLICKHNIQPKDYLIKYPNSKIESEEVNQKRFNSCKKYLKETYGVENLMHVKEIKDKAENNMRKTFREKYGVEHPMKSNIVKQLYKNSLIKKYGVDCIMRVKDIQKKQRAKYNKTCVERYGVDNTFSVLDIQKKAKINAVIKPNNIEYKIINEFKDLKYVGDGNLWIQIGKNKRRNPDFIQVNNNKILEVFGDYWHSEKKTGINEDIHCETVINDYKKSGYDCLIIWEKEIKNNFKLVKNKINNFLNKTLRDYMPNSLNSI